MNKLIFLSAVLVFAFQQSHGASDADVVVAYDELYNATMNIVFEVETRRENYTHMFLTKLAAEEQRGKETLNNKLADVTEIINAIADRTAGYPNIDTRECTLGIADNLGNTSKELQDKIHSCIYDVRYPTAINYLGSGWSDIVHLTMTALDCTSREIDDCKGNEACNDNLLVEFDNIFTQLNITLNLRSSLVLNSLDGFSFRCADRVIEEFDNLVEDILENVRSCVDRDSKSFAPIVCAKSIKH